MALELLKPVVHLVLHLAAVVWLLALFLAGLHLGAFSLTPISKCDCLLVFDGVFNEEPALLLTLFLLLSFLVRQVFVLPRIHLVSLAFAQLLLFRALPLSLTLIFVKVAFLFGLELVGFRVLKLFVSEVNLGLLREVDVPL